MRILIILLYLFAFSVLSEEDSDLKEFERAISSINEEDPKWLQKDEAYLDCLKSYRDEKKKEEFFYAKIHCKKMR